MLFSAIAKTEAKSGDEAVTMETDEQTGEGQEGEEEKTEEEDKEQKGTDLFSELFHSHITLYSRL